MRDLERSEKSDPAYGITFRFHIGEDLVSDVHNQLDGFRTRRVLELTDPRVWRYRKLEEDTRLGTVIVDNTREVRKLKTVFIDSMNKIRRRRR